MLATSKLGVGSLVHSALLIQHPIEFSGKTSSGVQHNIYDIKCLYVYLFIQCLLNILNYPSCFL